MKKTEPEYYPPVENLLDLIYEHYTENNPVEKNTDAGKAAKAKEKKLEEWLRGLDGMDRLVDDYVGDKIPLWEKIMDRQGTVCCAWEKTAFEEGLKALIVKVVVSKNIYFLFLQVIKYCSVPDVSINKLSTFIGNHVRHRILPDHHHFE